MTAIKDRFISREEISKLLWGMINDIVIIFLEGWYSNTAVANNFHSHCINAIDNSAMPYL